MPYEIIINYLTGILIFYVLLLSCYILLAGNKYKTLVPNAKKKVELKLWLKRSPVPFSKCILLAAAWDHAYRYFKSWFWLRRACNFAHCNFRLFIMLNLLCFWKSPPTHYSSLFSTPSFLRPSRVQRSSLGFFFHRPSVSFLWFSLGTMYLHHIVITERIWAIYRDTCTFGKVN